MLHELFLLTTITIAAKLQKKKKYFYSTLNQKKQKTKKKINPKSKSLKETTKKLEHVPHNKNGTRPN